jgi:hypothetical protein
MNFTSLFQAYTIERLYLAARPLISDGGSCSQSILLSDMVGYSIPTVSTSSTKLKPLEISIRTCRSYSHKMPKASALYRKDR